MIEEGKILALDPATTTGWAAFIDGNLLASGVWDVSGQRYEGAGMRWLRFRRKLEEAIEAVEPELVVYEEVRGMRSSRANQVYGALSSIIQAECEMREIPYGTLTPGTVKKYATGNGRANKDMMLEAAREEWPNAEIEDHNQADALWIGHCALNGGLG